MRTAQVPPERPKLIVAVSDSPDPAPGGSQVNYEIAVKNDGTSKAFNVVVTVPMPPGTEFFKCAVMLDLPTGPTPGSCTPPAGDTFIVKSRRHQGS